MSLYAVVNNGQAVNVYDPNTGNLLRSINGSSTGLIGTQGIALDNSPSGPGSGTGSLYAANNGTANSVTVYPPAADGDSPPIRTIGGSSSGLDGPKSVALDSASNLYVLNAGVRRRIICESFSAICE